MGRRIIFLHGKPQGQQFVARCLAGVLFASPESLASAPTQCLLTPVSHPVSLSTGEMKAALLPALRSPINY